MKRCYDKEEFDTDRSKGFLKRLNRILCSVTLKTYGVCVREEWPLKYHITGHLLCYDNSRIEFSQINFFAISIHSWLLYVLIESY